MAVTVTVRDLIARLQADYDGDELVVANLWSASDLLSANESVAEDTGNPPLSETNVQGAWATHVSWYVEKYLEIVTGELNSELVDQITYLKHEEEK